MHSKFEIFTKFKEFKAMVGNLSHYKIKVLIFDNGDEYCSKEFYEFCKHERVVRKNTTPYTPQQNGVAKIMNHTLLEITRSMLSSSKLDRYFWEEVIGTTCYLINRSLYLALMKCGLVESL